MMKRSWACMFDARLSQIHVSMPMHALWNHWSHVSQHTPGVVQRTAFFAYVAWEFGWSRIGSDVASVADKCRREVQIHTF